MVAPDTVLGWIESESDAFAATIRADTLDRQVPSCPDWDLRALVNHLGEVQRFWASVVRVGADVEPDFSGEEPVGPDDPAELEAWMRASTRELLDGLRETPYDAPAWTWWKEPRIAGAIARHQAQEAAVHRWDAQSAVGTPAPLPAALADDGVDEFVTLARQMGEPAPVAFRAAGTGRVFALADGPVVATASAPSNELVLLLYRRVSLDDIAVDGDRDALAGFLLPVE